MDKQTVEHVVYMLQLVHSADTDESRRKEAQEYCQRLKDSPDAMQRGIELASSAGSGLPPQVQHFGLQLVEHAVRHQWRRNTTGKQNNGGSGTIGTDEMLQVRDHLWKLIFEACERQTAAAYIKEKLVDVMVQLIIRLWPSAQWCNLSTQLMQLYSVSGSPVHREMALRIWRTLGEEMFVFDRDAMATVRK
ncbi:karyopherin, partial [Coemansia sp. RSA 1933]